ncbi:MAG TPA: Uma2 family endonuclease [Dehalococcoidia bacterium]|nr:Uma2 family endonuclease [Dehalococcoidia bacterium]
MVLKQRGLTLAEFLKLPEQKPSLEYFDGKVCRKVTPKGRHSAIQAGLTGLVNNFSVPRKLARAFTELRTTYAGASPVPDISIYRWERLPRNEAGRLVDDFVEPPPIAVEIPSPGQKVNRLRRRCGWYVEQGVRQALLILPDDESVISFRPGAEPQVLRGSDRIDLDEILPGFGLTAAAVFDLLS